jgi:transposase-like protein
VATFAGEGYSHRAVAQRFGVSQSTTSWCNVIGSSSTGETSEIAHCQETSVSRRLQMQLSRGTNVRIGLATIRQRLLENNLHIRRPATRPLLTAAHR